MANGQGDSSAQKSKRAIPDRPHGTIDLKTVNIPPNLTQVLRPALLLCASTTSLHHPFPHADCVAVRRTQEASQTAQVPQQGSIFCRHVCIFVCAGRNHLLSGTNHISSALPTVACYNGQIRQDDKTSQRRQASLVLIFCNQIKTVGWLSMFLTKHGFPNNSL